jgi:MutS domain V
MDPAREYESRLADWSRRAQAHDLSHILMGNLRLLLVIGLLVLAAVLCRSRVALGLVLLIMMLGLFLSGMVHDRVLNARDMARRAIRFYKSGLDRLAGAWAGKGCAGTEFLDPHHPYASDLDMLGAGSLFELLNAAQTQLGQATLAAWLLAPAAPEEILARQAAVNELRPKLDLRERLGLLAAEAQAWIRTDSLIAWARQPRLLGSNLVRVLIFCLPFISLAQYLAGRWGWTLAALAAQYCVARFFRRRVRQVTRSLGSAQGDLKRLAEMLRCLEQENFQSERLRRMEAACQCDGITASQAIKRLARLHDWLTSGDNLLFVLFCKWLMWETQFAFAIEAWRARFGPMVAPWLCRLAEMEALSSLSGYAFEHPADPFPEFLPATAPAQIEAEALGHPLIAEARCVRNDARLGPDRRLIVVSGSNMSGKSTYLRAIGVNMVLALAGAPVRASRLRMTPLQVGASIRTVDSLQEGTSRFYAEITRLAEIVKLAGRGTALVFLLDEILGGTNSHDRRIGAACVARSLVQRGALGLMTTHDLALARIVDEIQPPGANFHFEDQLQDGRMSFDYRLRPGIVEKSNALELMRSVGLDMTA